MDMLYSYNTLTADYYPVAYTLWSCFIIITIIILMLLVSGGVLVVYLWRYLGDTLRRLCVIPV